MRGFRRIGLTAVLAACGGGVAAQGLEGAFRGLFNDLTLDVAGDQAVAQVTSGACMGYLEGTVVLAGDGAWEVIASVPEAPCVLSVTAQADGRFEMIEGPGCTYYHGTSCELSGVLGRVD